MIGFIAVAVALQGQLPLPFLSPAFGDHMVLQRDRPNSFWGWTTPGTMVKVVLGGHQASAKADASGKWLVRISPPPVGGPYEVDINGPQNIKLNDVLVGDVWICSGQSNMEFGLGNVNNASAEIAAADLPNVRIAMVPRAIEYAPRATNGMSWSPVTPTSIAKDGWNGFSAVAYYFGRELNKRLNVPIGLVQTCWGGTIAEAWTSREGLIPLKDFDGGLAAVEATRTHAVKSPDDQFADWYAKNDADSKAGAESVGFDDSAWALTPSMPADYDHLNLSTFDGVVWYRHEITLPDTLPSGDATLSLGPIDDYDTSWVNGVHVGSTYYYSTPRVYRLPAGTLKPGKNVISIRCLDTGAAGGFTGSADALFLQLGDGTKISLAEPWKYKVGVDFKKTSPLPVLMNNSDPNVPTVLYNGMINPIVPLAIKGAIWYQGESNAGRAYQYRKLLPAMIGDWRRVWGEGEFPFFIVQLANFMAVDSTPQESEWAELREAQTLTAKNVKNVGLALSIDVGDAVDIHPKDKQTVGTRLALAALHTAYHQGVSYSGPMYRSFKRDGSSIRISFDHVEGGLKVKGESLKGFAIAGADHKFHWADAKIDGNSVIVSSADVPDPVAVRYDWGNNPASTLYNGADLPAVSFRTDDWPGVTAGRK